MGIFVTGNTALPALKTDTFPATGASNELDAADINNLWSAAGDLRSHASHYLSVSEYANIQATITAAGTTKGVIIPPGYAGTDTFTNPSGIPIIDLRTPYAFRGGYINIKDYGAVGDGVVDDTAAITAAYTAGGQGAMFFYPVGNYLVSGSPALVPPQGSVHVGASRGGATTCTRITYAGSGDCVLIDGKQAVQFRDMKFIITGSAGTERAIHVTNTAVASQWHNFENLFFLQFANGGASPRVAGQVAIFVESVAARAQYWCHFRRLFFQNWDKGIQFSGASSTAVVNGHQLYDIMGAANVTLVEFTKNAGDNLLVGLFSSASGYSGAQTAVVLGNGVDNVFCNRFYSVTSDAGSNAKPYDFKAATNCNYIETDSQSSLTGTDAGTLNTVKSIKLAIPNSFVIDTLGTISSPYFALTYSASITPDARLGNTLEINATNGTAFTINAPTNVRTGQSITFKIKNTSGGALGAVTWNAIFKMAAWVSPLTANSRSITFIYDGANWVESTRAAADVPN